MTISARVRHQRGLLVVILLAVIFFALLAALIFATGKRSTRRNSQSETLSVLPLRIRMRTEPNAKAPVVATETAGEKLILLEDRGAWVRVQDEEGMSGWAERNALERTSERERRLAEVRARLRGLPPRSKTDSPRAGPSASPMRV